LLTPSLWDSNGFDRQGYLTDDCDVLDRLDEERRWLVRDREVLDGLASITRLRAADGSHHTVIYSALTADTADAAITGEVEHHRRLGIGFEWKVYAQDRPADLLERLRRHGVDVGPVEAVLVCDLGRRPAWMNASDAGPTNAAAPRVERVSTPEHVAAFRRVAGVDYAFTAAQLAEGLRTGSTQHLGYLAYAGDEPVSAGRLYTHPEAGSAACTAAGRCQPTGGEGSTAPSSPPVRAMPPISGPSTCSSTRCRPAGRSWSAWASAI
jgi:hypothetical protein